MLDWYKMRCSDCIYMFKDYGACVCDCMGVECENIPDEDCPAKDDWDDTDPPYDILVDEEE